MGAVHFSIDVKLIERLKQLLPLNAFVETGTFEGQTLVNALPFFDRLYSVEVAEDQYRAAAQRLARESSIELHHGASAEFLGKLSPQLANESVLYWLDAHWCETTAPTGGSRAQCSLLRELEAVETLNERSVILIDDARYFLAPPPSPNDPTQWPKFDQVLSGLRALSSHHEVSVCDDVIIFSPKAIGNDLRAFLQRHGTDWLAVMHRAVDRDRRLAELAQALREAESDRSSRLAAIQALREGLQCSEADLRTCEADRAARLDVINELNKQLADSEADRSARLETINILQGQLQESEADRSARLETIDNVQAQLQASQADRAARLEVINALQERLEVSEADRATRLQAINALQERLEVSEADRATRLEAIDSLHERLEASEADRAARLEAIDSLQELLEVSEADRAARLEAIDSLQELLEVSEADRAARLNIITELEERLRAIEADHAARLDAIQSLQSSLQEWEADRIAGFARKLSRRLRDLRAGRKRIG